MKKLLGIVVLGLLLSGCGTISREYINYSGGDGNIVKKSGDEIHLGFTVFTSIVRDKKTNSILRTTILEPKDFYGPSKDFYADSRAPYARSDKNSKIASAYCESRSKFTYFFRDYTNEDPLNTNSAAIYICSDKDLFASPISGTHLLENDTYYKNWTKNSPIYYKAVTSEAKEICSDLGFKTGTANFANCTLQLFQAKVNPTKIVSSSGSSSTVTIYDPVRDTEALIKRGQGLINGKCTLADLSNC